MNADPAASQQPDELEQLDTAIAHEIEAIARLHRRTHILRVEVVGWKAPVLPDDDHYTRIYGVAGFVAGFCTIIGLNKLMAALAAL